MKRFSTHLLVALFALPLLLRSEPIQIETHVEPSVCKPGDLITLHTKYSGSEYIDFTIHIPEHTGLHFVQQQSSPVSYEDNTYEKVSTIQLQPTQPGIIELNNLSATVIHQGLEVEQALPSLQITVDAYDTSVVSDTPLPLPPSPELTSISQLPIQLWILFVFLACFIALCIFRVKSARKPVTETETSTPTLSDIILALEAGKVPTDLMTSVLEDPAQQLSKTSRQALEQAVYRPSESTDADTLLKTLGREANP